MMRSSREGDRYAVTIEREGDKMMMNLLAQGALDEEMTSESEESIDDAFRGLQGISFMHADRLLPL